MDKKIETEKRNKIVFDELTKRNGFPILIVYAETKNEKTHFDLLETSLCRNIDVRKKVKKMLKKWIDYSDDLTPIKI